MLFKMTTTEFFNMLLLIAIASPIMALSASAATRDLQLGIASYQAHNYSQAAAYLKKACLAQPSNADAHYYYANTLAYLHDGQNAIVEYQNCLRSHPSDVEAEYARAALEAYNAQIPISQTYSPAMESQSLPDAVARTSQQSVDLANRTALADGISIADMQDSGLIGSANISAAGVQTVADMECAHVIGPGGECEPAYSAADIEAARQYYQNYAASVQQATEAGARLAQQNLEDKERKLQDSITNLQDQLFDQAATVGGVKLSPVGTNIYVRNYE